MNPSIIEQTAALSAQCSYRILVVDDNPAIHKDFQKILIPARSDDFRADQLEAELFGSEPQPDGNWPVFELDFAHQGQEALQILNGALAEARPYALAFVDVRMPPGWDGIETVNQLWRVDPSLQIVICTAYSDYSWEKMRGSLMQPDSLVVLKKPFDNVEVQQLAHTLSRKWELNHQSAMAIRQLDKSISKLAVPRQTSDGGTAAAMVDPDLEMPPMSSADGLHFLSSLRRLGEASEATRLQLRQSESQLVQAEKMASLGRLSAGIIHEINNPLNYAMAALSLMEQDAKKLPEGLSGDHHELLRDMRDALDRISEITTSLRKFAHPDSGGLSPVVAHDSIATALRLMVSEIKDDIQVENRVPRDLIVWASSSKLAQVFINLIHNAAHALRDKEFPAGEKPLLAFECEVTELETHISVTDNGTGIAGDQLDHIFDPFYTTKEIGQGTGLGLSICQQILKSFGASIAVTSKPDEHTTFVIVFKNEP